MCVRQVHGLMVVDIELANGVALFLREQQPAIGRAHDAVGRLEVGPDQLPGRPGGDNAGNFADGGRTLTRQQLLR